MNQPSPKVLAVCAKWLEMWEPKQQKLCLGWRPRPEFREAACGESHHHIPHYYDIPIPPASDELEVALIRKLNAEKWSVTYDYRTDTVRIHNFCGIHEGLTIYDAVADILKRRRK